MSTPDYGYEPPGHACGVCGRVLDWHEDSDGTPRGWEHCLIDSPADHPPVPMPVRQVGEQLLPRCDFCLFGVPTHKLPARSFLLPGLERSAGSTGDWAACDECALAITRNAWNVVLRRAIAGHERQEGHVAAVVEPALRMLYGKLRKNITGAIRPDR